MVYIITISFIFIVSIVTIVIEGGTIGGTIDFPSMFVIVSTISMILFASNSWRDFFRAFKIVVSKKNYPALQIAHSMNSVSLVIDSLLCSCGMIVFLCLAMVINFSGDTQSWGVILALGLLTIFYTGEILLILYPLKSILYKKLSFLKKSPVQEIFVFSSIPFKPILVFFIGLLVLFLLVCRHIWPSLSYSRPCAACRASPPGYALCLGRKNFPFFCGFSSVSKAVKTASCAFLT